MGSPAGGAAWGSQIEGALQLAGRREQGLAALVWGCAGLSGLYGEGGMRSGELLGVCGLGDTAASENEARGSASIGTWARTQRSTYALYLGTPHRGVVLTVDQA